MGARVNATRAPRIRRRALLAATAAAASAHALGRTPYGGELTMMVPWALDRLDPHALDDPVAALFAAAVCDPLYALDALGRPYSALAAGLPEATAEGSRVRLRPGLASARGRRIDASAVVHSLSRAARLGALVPRAVPVRRPSRDPLALDFPGVAPDLLARELTSPLAAIVPRDYSPARPDGTGAFVAEFTNGRLTLRRNPDAARGPAFLEAIVVLPAPDLAESLRAFESGSIDVGWLGAGLHQPRSGAIRFRGALYGWVILRTGRGAGRWGAPGIAQQLLDGVPADRLRHLGLEGLVEAPTASATPGWGGGPATLVVRDDAPQLELIARALSAVLSRPGHEVTVARLPRAQLELRRKSRDFALMLDFVRSIGSSAVDVQRALLSAQDPVLARNPPRRAANDVRSVCRALTLGLVGELWAAGAHGPTFRALEGWQLGNVFEQAPVSATAPA